MKKNNITLTVNGTKYSLDVFPNETLLDVLRERLKLKDVKAGCLGGECGACTVLVNGRAMNSCLILAVEVDNAEIVTIRGLCREGKLHPLQEAFIREGAIQCGFCTPGFILTALSFLKENPKPSIQEIKKALAGNLCRCGSYPNIVKAIYEVSVGSYGPI
jgi:carbon-monoxide dehydrogenase small subunit